MNAEEKIQIEKYFLYRAFTKGLETYFKHNKIIPKKSSIRSTLYYAIFRRRIQKSLCGDIAFEYGGNNYSFPLNIEGDSLITININYDGDRDISNSVSIDTQIPESTYLGEELVRYACSVERGRYKDKDIEGLNDVLRRHLVNEHTICKSFYSTKYNNFEKIFLLNIDRDIYVYKQGNNMTSVLDIIEGMPISWEAWELFKT
jgi:hypothetical protein